MKYKIKNLTKNGTQWTCTVEYWEDCYCSVESVEVSIESERMPKKGDIIAAMK